MQIVQTSGQIHAGHDHGILGKWIETLTENLPVSEQVHEFITHFITDSLNIFLLLFVVMTAVYFLSSYINMNKLHHRLAHLNSVPGYLWLRLRESFRRFAAVAFFRF